MKEYIDLGLPSGKLWATENEEGYFTFDEAVEKFQDQLPTIADWQELIDNTTQCFNSNSRCLILLAENHKWISLPAMGGDFGNGIECKDNDGCYWSATRYNEKQAKAFNFDLTSSQNCTGCNYCKLSVRLIKAK